MTVFGDKCWRMIISLQLVDFGSPKKEGNQPQYVNPAIVQLGDTVRNLTEKVDSQEEK